MNSGKPVEILLRHFVKLRATEDETEGGSLMRSRYGGQAPGTQSQAMDDIGLAGPCAATWQGCMSFLFFSEKSLCQGVVANPIVGRRLR